MPARPRATGKPPDAEWAMVWKLRGGEVVYFREYTGAETMAAAVA
jgi:ketosteroid isomerase-like protein